MNAVARDDVARNATIDAVAKTKTKNAREGIN